MSSVNRDPEVERYLEQAFGKERLQSINACLERPPLHTCVRVNDLKVDVEEIIRRIKAQAEQEREGWLAAGKEPSVVPGVPFAVVVPGCGPNEIDYSCCGGREVVVSRKAGEAVLRGAPLYVPGVLACTAGIAAGDLVMVSVAVELPGSNSFGITRGTILGSAHEQQHCTKGGSTTPQAPRLRLGVGRTLLSRTHMFRQQSGVALVMEQRVYDVPSCSGVQQGDCMLQNLPSIVAAQVLAPPPGSLVLDMCASPGGKTTLLAQLMRDQGRVVALDRSHAKVLEIENLAKELGLSCITAYKMDSTRAAYEGAAATAAAGEVGYATTDTAGEAAGHAKGEAAAAAEQAAGQAAAGEAEGANVLGSRSAAAAAASGNTLDGLSSGAEVQGCSTGAAGSSGRVPAVGSSNGSGSAEPNQAAEQGLKRQREDAGGVEVVEGFMVFKEKKVKEGGDDKQDKRAARKAAARQLRGHAAPVSAEAQKAEGMGRVLCGFLPESFDYILLDGPCSALGLRPRLLHRQTLKELQQTAGYQRQLIDAAVRLLRPGGVMVYSTCTINPGENEGNVRYLLDAYPCMRLIPQHPHLGSPGLVGTPSHQALPPAPPSASPAAASCNPTCTGTKHSLCSSDSAASTAIATINPSSAATTSSTMQHPASRPASAQALPTAAGPKSNPPGSPTTKEHSAAPACGARVGSGAVNGTAGHTAVSSGGPWGGGVQERWLTESEAQLVQRFHPDGPLDTIGFFIAKFQKTGPLLAGS